MKNWKAIMSVSLALALPAGNLCAYSMPVLADEKSVPLSVEEYTLIESDFLAFEKDRKVANEDEAKELIRSLDLNLDPDAFDFVREIEDPAGNNYYQFQQMYNSTTVSGGAIKVVTDKDDSLTGVIYSVEETPDEEKADPISAQQAEETVSEKEQKDAEKEYTSRTMLPVDLKLDINSEKEKIERRYVWVVYTKNDDADRPYKAHYVAMDGSYLYSQDVREPNDEESLSGYNATYIFDEMEPVEYSGKAVLDNGTERELHLELMKGKDGLYYLGNLERRILMADGYEFCYNDLNLVPQTSEDNTWDDKSLLTLDNYIKAYDYYNEMGWEGPDGKGTPILILNNITDKDKNPYDNACYFTEFGGWQFFGCSPVNDYSECLDVIAHEFTHCVTRTAMLFNYYRNDSGAINEAMSDIQGENCDQMKKTAKDLWQLGDNSVIKSMRSMDHPNAHQQPGFTWDRYYKDNVKVPTTINDRGGVHSNSSILNSVLYILCTEGGMTHEDARAYWFAVDQSMVAGTDYTQLAELLPWVLKNVGMDQYLDALELALEKTRMGEKELPETFDEDTAALQLVLPDEDIFTDGHWGLLNVTFNPDKLVSSLVSMVFGSENGVKEQITSIIALLEETAGEVGKMIPENREPGERAPLKELDPETKEALQEKLDQLKEFMGEYFTDIVFQDLGAAGSDGCTITTVGIPGYTVPILFRAKMEGMDVYPSEVALLACFNGEWMDLGSILDNLNQTINQITLVVKEKNFNKLLEIDFLGLLDNFLTVRNMMDNEDQFLFKIEAGKVNRIPDKGLDTMTPHIIDTDGMGSLITSMMEQIKAQQEDTEEDTAGTAESAEEDTAETAESGEEEAASSQADSSAEDTGETETTDDEPAMAA